jgi:hypothetical protein
MEPETKTDELVALLKELHNNEYAGVSGYLQGVVVSFEREYKSASDLLQHFIDAVKEELAIKNNNGRRFD